ncbi:MAG: hypothetical protein HOH20_08195 [Rhodospirillaceae bacterium]|nr:hypothetical protein [Rhodospirillaceae bacterium]MBT5241916.1 hypothetical protein [Rhodospirillaceae bacterium]MBT5567065.1 hypothetical protein [Rhodospirillaceae bacterium]MBT6089542.1 hypothetical protein [Rhodospirillaceae bacterium]MBT6961448.1 hypothetical protein [Rhodospirillaceae bacterium]
MSDLAHTRRSVLRSLAGTAAIGLSGQAFGADVADTEFILSMWQPQA